MKIKLILAIDRKGCIGINDTLPWRLSDDLKHFKKLTLNSTIVMGSKTYKSLPGLLPNRKHIILSKTLKDEKVTIFNSINDLLNSDEKEIFLIGGANIAKQFISLGLIDELYITRVDTIIENGDTFIDINTDNYSSIMLEEYYKNDKNEYNFKIYHYKK